MEGINNPYSYSAPPSTVAQGTDAFLSRGAPQQHKLYTGRALTKVVDSRATSSIRRQVESDSTAQSSYQYSAVPITEARPSSKLPYPVQVVSAPTSDETDSSGSDDEAAVPLVTKKITIATQPTQINPGNSRALAKEPDPIVNMAMRSANYSPISTRQLNIYGKIQPTPLLQQRQVVRAKSHNIILITANFDAAMRNEVSEFPNMSIKERISLLDNKTDIIANLIEQEKKKFSPQTPITICVSSEGRTCLDIGRQLNDIIYKLTGAKFIRFIPYNESKKSLSAAITFLPEDAKKEDSLYCHLGSNAESFNNLEKPPLVSLVESSEFKTYFKQDENFSGRYMPYKVLKTNDGFLGIIRYHIHPNYSRRCEAIILLEEKTKDLKQKFKPLTCLIIGEINLRKKRFTPDVFNKEIEAKALKASDRLLEEFSGISKKSEKLMILGKAIQTLNFDTERPTICSTFDIVPGLCNLKGAEDFEIELTQNDIMKIYEFKNLFKDLQKKNTKLHCYDDLSDAEISELVGQLSSKTKFLIYRALAACDILSFPYLGHRSAVYSNGEAVVDVKGVLVTHPTLKDMDISTCKKKTDFIRVTKRYVTEACYGEERVPPFLTDHPITIMSFLKGIGRT